MVMQLYAEDGFTDEFESRVIEKRITRSSWVEWVSEDGKEQYYQLKKKNVQYLIDEFQEEKMRQKEKSLFKKKPTRTLNEFKILINILNVLANDQVVPDEEYIAMFVVEKDQLLDI